jgi:Na+-transporting NADH:ubiquinone oxidoreductase subunit NqrD
MEFSICEEGVAQYCKEVTSIVYESEGLLLFAPDLVYLIGIMV